MFYVNIKIVFPYWILLDKLFNICLEKSKGNQNVFFNFVVKTSWITYKDKAYIDINWKRPTKQEFLVSRKLMAQQLTSHQHGTMQL